MKLFQSGALTSLAVSAVLGTCVAPAHADADAPFSIEQAGPVVAGKGATTVPVVYTCTEPTHVWAAVKQGDGVQEDPSSQTNPGITSYYDTNWKSDAGPNALRCDGRERRQTLVLKQAPWFTHGTPLVSGEALLQLCMESMSGAFTWNADDMGTYPMIPLVAAR